MDSSTSNPICEICSKENNQYITKLGIFICHSCWNSPNTKKNRFYYWGVDIDKINEKIFLGNEAGQNKKEILKALGVTNILVVGSGLQIFNPSDFIYKKIEIEDFYSENISKYFNDCYDFIERSKGNVYVHCAAGISRSTTIVIAYLMRKKQKGFLEMFEFVKSRRKYANPNEGFISQLKEYEKILHTMPKI